MYFLANSQLTPLFEYDCTPTHLQKVAFKCYYYSAATTKWLVNYLSTLTKLVFKQQRAKLELIKFKLLYAYTIRS